MRECAELARPYGGTIRTVLGHTPTAKPVAEGSIFYIRLESSQGDFAAVWNEPRSVRQNHGHGVTISRVPFSWPHIYPDTGDDRWRPVPRTQSVSPSSVPTGSPQPDSRVHPVLTSFPPNPRGWPRRSRSNSLPEAAASRQDRLGHHGADPSWLKMFGHCCLHVHTCIGSCAVDRDSPLPSSLSSCRFAFI